MQSAELSLAGKLDNGLTKGLCLLIGWLINACIWILGLLMLITQSLLIFEYGEGLADVSWHEWGFMLIFALLLWRHVRYCQHFTIGFWSGLSRLLIFQGRLGAVTLTIFGFEPELAAQFDPLSTAVDPSIELAAFGIVLLLLYLAAPTTSGSSAIAKPVSTSRVEPTFNSAEKDVTA